MYRTEETVQVIGNPFITIVAHGGPTSSCLRPFQFNILYIYIYIYIYKYH